jgi:hypothetical protein
MCYILDVAINKHSFKEAFMVNNLSITRNGDEEVTITLPFTNKNKNAKLSKVDYDNFVRRMTQHLATEGISNNLTLLLYKVELQEMIVFDFKGKKESIDKFIKSVN